MTMKRREFLSQAGTALGGLMTLAAFGQQSSPAGNADSRPRLRWNRDGNSRLFAAVSWDGAPLVRGDAPGLLDGTCRLLDEAPAKTTWLSARCPRAEHGPLRVELRHELRDTGRGLGEDLLEAVLTVRNVSDQAQRVELAFATSVQPSGQVEQQQVYVPLNAAGLAGDGRFAALGVKQFLKDGNQQVGRGEFTAHYLEPLASYPSSAKPVPCCWRPSWTSRILSRRCGSGCSRRLWTRDASARSVPERTSLAGMSDDA